MLDSNRYEIESHPLWRGAQNMRLVVDSLSYSLGLSRKLIGTNSEIGKQLEMIKEGLLQEVQETEQVVREMVLATEQGRLAELEYLESLTPEQRSDHEKRKAASRAATIAFSERIDRDLASQ